MHHMTLHGILQSISGARTGSADHLRVALAVAECLLLCCVAPQAHEGLNAFRTTISATNNGAACQSQTCCLQVREFQEPCQG